MRGKGCRTQNAAGQPGITPAYAGKSDVAQSVAQQTKDHPRLCGEKIRPTGFKLMIKGSPPPMRGKEQKGVFRMKRAGITPAYAGKSSIRCASLVEIQDHPRLCGEKLPSIRTAA